MSESCDLFNSELATFLQYYDWDNNFCHRLDFMNDNSITEIESDTEIPSEIDPSQMTSFPEFEPQKLKEMVNN